MHYNKFVLFTIIILSFFTAQSLVAQHSIPQAVHPEWSYDKSIYELNIRQFSEEGTFAAVEKELPRLKEMGFGIIWLMPIHPIGEKNRKGTLGSYYSVKDYLDVNPEFGTKEDFRSLVNKIHELGMYVIIDWVANHTAWDNPLTESNPDWFTKDANGNFVPPVDDWSDVIDLNYDYRELWDYKIGALKYWVEEFNIDGYRCDVAGMVLVEFWNEASKQLDKIKPVFMLAEDEGVIMHEKAFDMTYAWEFHKIMNSIAKGEKNVSHIISYFEREQQRFPPEAFRMHFTSNHDENTWNGTVFERLGDAAETFAALTFVIPGMPLVYNGQEAGMDKRLQFFEKDPIEWKEHPFSQLYTNLINLKTSNSALHNGERGGDMIILNNSEPESVFSFMRIKDDNKVFALFNLTSNIVTVTIPGEILSGNFKEFPAGNEHMFEGAAAFTLEGWEYKIFTR